MSSRSSQRTSAIFRAPSSVSSVAIAAAKLLLPLLVLPLVGNAQCPPPVGNGSHTITAEITKNSTGVALNDGDLVSAGDSLRFDSIVTTNGGCQAACTSYPNLINHIAVTADISTNGFPNGNYSVGNVFGRNPDGSTGYFQVLDTQATNSTGRSFTRLPLQALTLFISRESLIAALLVRTSPT